MDIQKAKEEWMRAHPQTEDQRQCEELCDISRNHGHHDPKCPILNLAVKRSLNDLAADNWMLAHDWMQKHDTMQARNRKLVAAMRKIIENIDHRDCQHSDCAACIAEEALNG